MSTEGNNRTDRDPPLPREEELFTPSHLDALHSVAVSQSSYVQRILVGEYGASPEKLAEAFDQDKKCHFIKANGKPLDQHGGAKRELDEVISYKTFLTFPALGAASVEDKSIKDRISTMIASTKKMFDLGGEDFANAGYQVVGAVYQPANTTILNARRRAYNEDPGNFCCDDARRDAEALFGLVADKKTFTTDEVRLNPAYFGEKVRDSYKEEWITGGTPLPMEEVMHNLRLNMSAYSYGGAHVMQSLGHLAHFMEDIGFGAVVDN